MAIGDRGIFAKCFLNPAWGNGKFALFIQAAVVSIFAAGNDSNRS